MIVFNQDLPRETLDKLEGELVEFLIIDKIIIKIL